MSEPLQSQTVLSCSTIPALVLPQNGQIAYIFSHFVGKKAALKALHFARGYKYSPMRVAFLSHFLFSPLIKVVTEETFLARQTLTRAIFAQAPFPPFEHSLVLLSGDGY